MTITYTFKTPHIWNYIADVSHINLNIKYRLDKLLCKATLKTVELNQKSCHVESDLLQSNYSWLVGMMNDRL